MRTAIRVENLGKCYRIGHDAARGPYRTLRESLTEVAIAPLRRLRRGRPRSRDEDFWALRDVNFTIEPGEVIGIIGRNGAGKSTLLKILSRIAKPTTGRALLFGRVGSLLEVGTGFHPELTGRENIFLNGAILGMSRREILRNFDEIVDFSGIEEFLDTPVKRYSSGMYVRLAFAVSAHLETEILFVDEVLAVGDMAFQKKCMGKMQGLSREGRTVVLVSHNMSAIRGITERCLYLRNGQVQGDGPTPDVIDLYLKQAWDEASIEEEHGLDDCRRDRSRDTTVTLRRIGVRGGPARPPVLRSGDPIPLYFEIESHRNVPGAFITFSLLNQQGERVATFLNHDQGERIDLVPGLQTIHCLINDLPLTPGRYTITSGVNKNASGRAFDVILDYPIFSICMPELESGTIDWPSRSWGCVHWKNVSWSTDRTIEDSAETERPSLTSRSGID